MNGQDEFGQLDSQGEPGPIRLDQPGIYRIKLQGRLNARTLHRFEGLAATVETVSGGRVVTTLTGPIVDQSALHGVLAQARDLGLPLLLVELVGPLESNG